MSTKIRLGFIGCEHDYAWVVARHIRTLKLADADVELVAAAEPSDSLRQRLMSQIPIPRSYADWRQMLDQERFDAIVVATDNLSHPEVCVACAERGIDTIFDKPMAATYAGALAMFNAARKYGVRIMSDYPHAWYPGFRMAADLIRDGWIGDVFEIQYRVCNKGPAEIGCEPAFTNWLFDESRGGGAFLDYTCYGANVTRWYLGANPTDVVALGGTWCKPGMSVEDNAVLLMRYPKGFSYARSSWTQQGFEPPDGPFILGEKGSIVVEHRLEHGDLGFHSWRNAAGVVKVYLKGWSSWLSYTPPPLPVGQRSGIDHFIWCIQNDQPLIAPVDEQTNLDVQAVMDAGLTAMKGSQFVSLQSVTG